MPGSGPSAHPLITLDELERLLLEWAPLVSTRSVEATPASTKTAFCAMPFHKDFLDVYFLGILPAVREAGFDLLRVDQTHSFRGITQRVWDGIANSSFVIADLSGHNPNVMYEVGLAHALGCRTFLLKDDATDIPFDVRDHMVLNYSRLQLHRLSAELPDPLKSALQQT